MRPFDQRQPGITQSFELLDEREGHLLCALPGGLRPETQLRWTISGQSWLRGPEWWRSSMRSHRPSCTAFPVAVDQPGGIQLRAVSRTNDAQGALDGLATATFLMPWLFGGPRVPEGRAGRPVPASATGAGDSRAGSRSTRERIHDVSLVDQYPESTRWRSGRLTTLSCAIPVPWRNRPGVLAGPGGGRGPGWSRAGLWRAGPGRVGPGRLRSQELLVDERWPGGLPTSGVSHPPAGSS